MFSFSSQQVVDSIVPPDLPALYLVCKCSGLFSIVAQTLDGLTVEFDGLSYMTTEAAMDVWRKLSISRGYANGATLKVADMDACHRISCCRAHLLEMDHADT